MIKSMTGFAALTHEHDVATISVTIKSVNHRFLDLQLRLPPTLATLEARVRARAQAHVARGRVEVAVAAQERLAPALEIELNEPLLAALGSAIDRARERGYVTGTMTPGDLLRFPQAITIRERAGDGSAADTGIGPLVEAAVDAAFAQLEAMRITEGAHLAADLEARRIKLSELFEQVAAAADSGMAGLQARLIQRIHELRAEALADEALVAQEVARFVGRSDITEEVVRFRGHLLHWQALASGPEPCGRKLDFLLQEMNREVNTAGTKAEGPLVSEIIVSLKAELEKVREQVQNVE